jgi:hypothetical protein
LATGGGEAIKQREAPNAGVDNEVYRAWWEMTRLLEVDAPETATPGEFADAAVELGIDEAYVDPLTTLFEEVRYGHRDAESREERAIEVFRALAAAYGSDTDAGGTGDRSATDADVDDTEGDT